MAGIRRGEAAPFIRAGLAATAALFLVTGCCCPTTIPLGTASTLGSVRWIASYGADGLRMAGNGKAVRTEEGYFTRSSITHPPGSTKASALIEGGTYWTVQCPPGHPELGVITGYWYHQNSASDPTIVTMPFKEEPSAENASMKAAETETQQWCEYRHITHPPGGACVDCTFTRTITEAQAVPAAN